VYVSTDDVVNVVTSMYDAVPDGYPNVVYPPCVESSVPVDVKVESTASTL